MCALASRSASGDVHPFDAAGRQCALDVVRVDIADRAFRDVGQGSDTRVRVEAPVEGRALMVEKVEKHEWLQDLAHGLIKRVARPCVRPRVRCTIARALLGGGDLAGSRSIGVPLKIAWE